MDLRKCCYFELLVIITLLQSQAIAKIYRGPIIGTPTIEQWHRNFSDLREAEFDEEEAHFSFSIHELELFGNTGEPLKKIVTAFTSNKRSYELPTYYYLDRDTNSGGGKQVLTITPGDFIREINGYFTADINNYNSLFYLTGLRAISNSSGEIWVGYSGAGTDMMSIEGPIVGFYGAIYFDSQSVFGGIGVFIDPSLWPTDLARSRLVKGKMLGYLFIQSNSWNYFDHYEDNDRPFSMRIVNLTIEYNEVYVYKMNITYEITREIGQSEGRYTWRSLGGDGRYPECCTITKNIVFGNWRDYIAKMIVGTTTQKHEVGPCLEYLKLEISYSNEEELVVMEFGQRRISMGDWTELEIERPVAFHGIIERGCINMLGAFSLTASNEVQYACTNQGAFNFKLDHITAGTTAYVKCNEADGEFVSRDIPVVCREDGFWNWQNDDGFPFCSKQCNVNSLPSVSGRYIFKTDLLIPFEKVEVECLPGYYLYDSGTIQCGTDGEWNITGLVTCFKECPLPLPPAYGTILYHSDDPFQYNDIVVIECNDEYMLNGSDKYICNALPATFDLIGDVVPICEDFLFNGTNPFPETCPTSATTQEETVTTPTTAGPLPAQGTWNSCSSFYIPGVVVLLVLIILIFISIGLNIYLCKRLKRSRQKGSSEVIHRPRSLSESSSLAFDENTTTKKILY